MVMHMTVCRESKSIFNLTRFLTSVGSGNVSYEGFQKGLQALGINCGDGEDFQTFIQKVDSDHSGAISFREFVNAVRMIKLAHLFKPETIHEIATIDPRSMSHSAAVISVADYSPSNIRIARPLSKLQSFMFSSKPSWATNRWLSLAGVDSLSMRRLAIKYQLHPLSIEDTLNTNIEGSKFEHFDDHFFLVSLYFKCINLISFITVDI